MTAEESGTVLFHSTAPTRNHLIYGNIRIEGEDVTLADSSSGLWWQNGSISVRGNDVIVGKFIPRRIMTLYTSGPFQGETRTWEPQTSQIYTLNGGSNLLSDTSVAKDVSALIYVGIISPSNYDYRYLLNVTHDGGGGFGFVNILATIKTQDNGVGPPVFSVNGSGKLIITNNNYNSNYVATVYKTALGAEAYPTSN